MQCRALSLSLAFVWRPVLLPAPAAGIIESIDGASLAADLARLGDASALVALPIYDRGTHEAAQGRLHVGPQHGLVLVEGLHLLSR